MKRIIAPLLFLALLASPVWEAKYDLTIPDIANSTFKDIVKEAGMLTAYRGIAPAEPQGLTGFDIGVEASAIKLDTGKWDQVLKDGDAPSYIVVPKLHLRKGLPFGIDVGASYTKIPQSNIEVFGGEVQYAILDGGVALPALAVRGHYSQLLGVNDLDLKAYGADAVISKGFLMVTPYLGAGVVRVDGKYAGNDTLIKANLDDQSETLPRVFGGVQLSLALLRLTVDAEYSEVPVYTAKLSLGW